MNLRTTFDSTIRKQAQAVHLSLGLIAVLSNAIFGYAYAQAQYHTVYDLFFELTKYPETGDQLITKNQTLFDQQFYSCVNKLIQEYQRRANDRYDFCETLDGENRRQCHLNNEPMKMHNWLVSIVPVTRGQALWSQTIIGQESIWGKKYWETTLVPQTPGLTDWVSQVETVLPVQRPSLSCE